jgi:hypothetical protein
MLAQHLTLKARRAVLTKRTQFFRSEPERAESHLAIDSVSDTPSAISRQNVTDYFVGRY